MLEPALLRSLWDIETPIKDNLLLYYKNNCTATRSTVLLASTNPFHVDYCEICWLGSNICDESSTTVLTGLTLTLRIYQALSRI